MVWTVWRCPTLRFHSTHTRFPRRPQRQHSAEAADKMEEPRVPPGLLSREGWCGATSPAQTQRQQSPGKENPLGSAIGEEKVTKPQAGELQKQL